MKTVKRYRNRKLYDTEESRYITLKEIAAYVKKGGEVKVVDNSTGEDITSVTLAQVLLGEEKEQKGELSLSKLHSLLQSGGQFIQRTIGQPVSSLRDEAERRARKLIDSEPAEDLREFLLGTHKTLDEFQKRIEDRWQMMLAAIRSLSPVLKELDSLRERIEDMERRVQLLEKRVVNGKVSIASGRRHSGAKGGQQ